MLDNSALPPQPESKVCRACGQAFYREAPPKHSAFHWARRKFCSQVCSRSAVRGRGKTVAAPSPAVEGRS